MEDELMFIKRSTMEAIATATKEKLGSSDPLYPKDLPDSIRTIDTAVPELMLPADFPNYVRDEVMEVANKVRGVLTDESIVFLAMSDSHYPAEQVLNFYDEETRKSTVQANQAAKALAYVLNLDFVAHLGDVSSGAGSTTPEMLKSQIEGFVSYFKEANSNIPMFLAIGNHDAGIYYHDVKNQAGETGVYTLSGKYLYDNFTKYSESDNTVVGGEEYGGYCYRDFKDKKLRVFLLNTSEAIVYGQSDQATLGAQRLWLANALLDLNSKSDVAEWKFIILCHYPADYGATMPLSELLKAYVEGTSFTITNPSGGYAVGDNTNETVDFTGKNIARFIAQFHGHVHNFKTARLNSIATGSPVEYDAWRICIPNGQYNRENYYTSAFSGIYFNEEKSYPKKVDTFEGTSFVVNVINPSENVVHSICYGAGYDRSISLDGVAYYSVHTDLTGATIESNATTIRENESYIGTVTLMDDYTLETLVVTMGDSDITDEVYADGVINIEKVTGTVTITVVAKAPPVNLLTIALDTDGNLFNGGKGYTTGYRISSTDGSTKESAGSYISGYMPVDIATDTLVLHNIGTNDVNYSEAKIIGINDLGTTINGQVVLKNVTPNDDGSLTITRSNWPANTVVSAIKYVRLSCSYIGDDSSVLRM